MKEYEVNLTILKNIPKGKKNNFTLQLEKMLTQNIMDKTLLLDKDFLIQFLKLIKKQEHIIKNVYLI